MRPISKKMFDSSSLLRSVRCMLPEQEILPGRNNDMAIVSTKYILHSSDSRWDHLEKYTKVGNIQKY